MSEPQIERLGGVTESVKLGEPPFLVEDFSPFTSDQVKNVFRIIDRELLWVTLTSRPSNEQFNFVNNTVVTTSRLVKREINTYKVDLPRLDMIRTGAGMLPNLVRRLQETSGDRGLQEVCTNCNGRLLGTPESWIEVADQMATGKVIINRKNKKNKKHRESMEDYAVGMIHFIMLLANKNDGLVVDDQINRQFGDLLDGYNKLYEPQLSRRQKVALSVGKILGRYSSGFQVE